MSQTRSRFFPRHVLTDHVNSLTISQSNDESHLGKRAFSGLNRSVQDGSGSVLEVLLEVGPSLPVILLNFATLPVEKKVSESKSWSEVAT